MVLPFRHGRFPWQECVVASVCLLVFAGNLKSQKFHFGGNFALIASQVNGDNLHGFHKIGYSGGILGGYSLSPASWISVELQYSLFGSEKRNEETSNGLIIRMNTINVLTAYSLRFGDAWDGAKRFRVQAGPRIHRTLEAKIGTRDDRSQVSTTFLSGHLGFGILISEHVILDLGYNHVLGDILKNEIPDVEILTPYYLSVGVTYYLNR